MKGSLIIIGFFVLGTLCGIFHLIPVDAVMDSKVSFYALCALMFSVGLSVGNDPQTLKNFRSLNPPAGISAHYDDTGHAGRLCSGQPHPDAPFPDRLPGRRFGIRILFTLQYLHYRIQRSRTRNYRPTRQYQPRDTYPAGSTVTGTLVWQPGSHLCRRRHNDGYHTPDNHPYRRTAVCRSLHISRICSGFQRAVSGDLVLFDIGDYRQSAASNVEIRILS